MKPASGLLALTVHLAIVSSISFGGFPTVLPDVRAFVVTTHGWITDQDFTNIFAMAQAIPGPNMILMMGLIGWKVSGLAGAFAAATATFAPPCAVYFAAFRLMRRFQEARWQRVVRSALIPVTTGLIIASGIVMAQAAGISWTAGAVTGAAVVAMMTRRLNPLWRLAAPWAASDFWRKAPIPACRSTDLA
jgi:chromate transporter